MWFQPLTKINNAASPKLHFFVFQLPNYVVLKKTRAWLFASKNVPQKIPFLFQLIRSSWNFFDKPSQLLYIDIDFDYPSNQNKQRKKIPNGPTAHSAHPYWKKQCKACLIHLKGKYQKFLKSLFHFRNISKLLTKTLRKIM